MDGIKICPKCKGNVFIDWDMGDGACYEYCIQCAYRHYLPVLVDEGKEKLAIKSKRRRRKRRKK